jgi:mRNA interferase MazF
MRRGDIYFANLEPVQGSEANKIRPVLIVSNDALNEAVDDLQQGVITIVPLTSSVENVRSYQVFLPAEITGLKQDSKAQIEQVRALAVQRFIPELKGSLSKKYLGQIDKAIRLHFAV